MRLMAGMAGASWSHGAHNSAPCQLDFDDAKPHPPSKERPPEPPSRNSPIAVSTTTPPSFTPLLLSDTHLSSSDFKLPAPTYLMPLVVAYLFRSRQVLLSLVPAIPYFGEWTSKCSIEPFDWLSRYIRRYGSFSS
jgi:hypothetical protein